MNIRWAFWGQRVCQIDSKRRLGNTQRLGDIFFHSFSLRVWQVNTAMTAEKLLSVTYALPSITRPVHSHTLRTNILAKYFCGWIKAFQVDVVLHELWFCFPDVIDKGIGLYSFCHFFFVLVSHIKVCSWNLKCTWTILVGFYYADIFRLYLLPRLVWYPKIYWSNILRACVSLSAVASCPFKVCCWNRSASAVQQRNVGQFLTHVSNIFLHKPSNCILLGFHLIRMICGIRDVTFPLLLPRRECNCFLNFLNVNLFIFCT